MQDVQIPVDGGHLTVWHRGGNGIPAVLIAGLTGNSRWWTRVIEHLPKDLDLIAFDVRGRAGSVDAPPPFDMETLADDVARALDHFGHETAIVAGYSMGGWIASVFGERHPERTAQLVLIDGGLEVPAPPGLEPDQIIDAVVGPSLARLGARFENRDELADYWRAHPALSSYWDDEMLRSLDHEITSGESGLRVAVNPEAVMVSGREITIRADLDTAVFRQTSPVHIIVVERGTADQPGGMIPLSTAETAASSYDHITYEYVPDVNHYTLVLGKGAPAVAAAIARPG